MDSVWYDQSRLVAKVKVMNTIVDPTFTLMSSNSLVRSVCPKCLSSIDRELRIDLGQLEREVGTAEKNLTIWMSWELHRSWEAKCGGGGLTWLYNTETSMTIVCD